MKMRKQDATLRGDTASPRWWIWGCRLASCASFLFLIIVIEHYYFRYPFSDEWNFIPMLDKAFQGQLTWKDYWAPYHGHRLFFAYVVMIPLVQYTHWDHSHLVVLNILVGAAMFAMTVFVLRRSFKALGRTLPASAFPVTALLIFSLNQWCNWAWGWQFVQFLSVAATVAGLIVLSGSGMARARLGIAIMLGVISTYSFGTGIAFWAAGLTILLLPLLWRERIHWGHVGIWCVVATIVFAGYVAGFEHPEYDESGTFLPKNYLVLIPYVLTYIGANVTFFRPWAAWPIGLGALAFVVWAHVTLVRKRSVPHPALAPFSGLIVFVVASGLLTGVGRSAQYGFQQAAVARYMTQSQFFWVAVVFLLYVMATGEAWWPLRQPFQRRLAQLGIAGVCGLAILSSRQGYYELDEHYKVYMPEARRLVMEDPEEVPPRLNPHNFPVENERAVLEKWQLSIFRPQAQSNWQEFTLD